MARELEQQRPEAPRPPVFAAEEQREERARAEKLQARLRLEQRSLLRGLLLIAAVIVLASLWHAGFGRLFVPGWWRQW